VSNVDWYSWWKTYTTSSLRSLRYGCWACRSVILLRKIVSK